MKRNRAAACLLLLLALLPLSGCALGGTHRNWGVTAFHPQELRPQSHAVEPAEMSPAVRQGLLVLVQQRNDRGRVCVRWFSVTKTAPAIGG